ncbi:hypothetical protein [Nocardioides sp. B-3]|uniref:hypothetical protein n=1 Tax=Nocardioides sp. B-3 TaxID=2895565 RepID=UPI002152C188|nr:hypothetical protein [Nocardioides sp. B-3]UUZ60170.1 hypothetical protein LP418_04290 [Nocardioides sp. B-3]
MPPTVGRGTLEVRGPVVGGVLVPDLTAAPGETVLVRSAEPGRVRSRPARTGGHRGPGTADVRVAGRPLAGVPPEERRVLVGHAARDLPLERGTLARAVRYRRPDSDQPIDGVLAARGAGCDSGSAARPGTHHAASRR